MKKYSIILSVIFAAGGTQFATSATEICEADQTNIDIQYKQTARKHQSGFSSRLPLTIILQPERRCD